MRRPIALLFALLAAGCSASTQFYRAEPDTNPAVVSNATPFDNDANVVVLAREDAAVETSMAISPRDPDNAVVASMGYHGQRLPFADAHFTRDGGKTWTRRTLELTGTDGVPYEFHSDPAIGVDANGIWYYATMLIQRSGRISMAVSRSDDGGDTWTRPVNVSDTNGATVTDDKEWLAVDDTTGAFAGNVYMMWGRYYLDANGDSINGEIVFSRSTDRGVTWSEPMPLTAKSRVGMSMLAIGPNGEVYASFNDAAQHRLRVSTDGGVTFSPARAVPVVFGPGGKIPNTQANFSPMHTIAVDRSTGLHRGTLYYFSPTRGRLRQNNTFVSAAGMWVSHDGGATWQGPRLLSQKGGENDAVFPMVAVDQSTGDAVASWLDRRDDPSNTLFRLYASRSTDGGRSWSEPVAFTSPFSLDRSFLGHYLWSASQSGRWMSTVTDAAGKMSVVHLDFGQPRPDGERRGKRRSVR
ncbi:MAG TPA: sialidase family protein [Thermoanaerobaculia bacterium]|jgi:hypothetical protein